MTETLTIDPAHLRNERNNYADWPFAFWREFFQNSLDAGADNIRIEYHPKQEGSVLPNGMPQRGTLIKFIDNGTGMDEATLRNVFFRIGATTKGGAMVGGNGKTRLLTCFSHFSYGIVTQNCVVNGENSRYDLQLSDTFAKGCSFWIDADTETQSGNADLVGALKNYLSLAQMDCRIASNLPDVDGYSDWLYKRRLCRTLSFGNVYVNKSGGRKGLLVVRVNGAPMFTKEHRADAQVVIEIEPEKNRLYLVSNRDSLKYGYERELDLLLQEIAVDKRSALKVVEPIERIIGDEHSVTVTTRRQAKAKRTRKELAEAIRRIDEEEVDALFGRVSDTDATDAEADEHFSSDSSGDVLEVGETDTLVHTSSHSEHDVIRSLGYSPCIPQKPRQQFLRGIPKLVLYCDTADAAQRKALWLFNPENKDGKYFGSTKKKLAILWNIACEAAIQAWLERTDQQTLKWTPGFLFSDNARAMNRVVNGVTQLLLRPVDSKGTIRFRLNKRSDRIKMLVSAVHEVAHISEKYHDEDFTSLVDDLTELVMDRLSEIMRRMNESIRN